MQSRERYSLRESPRKKELYDGMVPTPGRRSTRGNNASVNGNRSVSDGDSAGESTASAAAAVAAAAMSHPQVTRRKTGRFLENLDEDGPAASPLDETRTMPWQNGNGRHISAESYRSISGSTAMEMNGLVNGKHLESSGECNGHANRYSNGHVKSHTNGPSNGHTSSKSSKPTQHALTVGERLVDGWAPGLDPKIDYSGHTEFGGSVGVTIMMVFFPLLMWYMWIGATYYGGAVPWPVPGQSWREFGAHLWHLVYTGAFPSLRAWRIYWTFFVFEAACYCLMPGVWAKGKPLHHENDKQLSYYCSAYSSFYLTILTMAVLHVTGIFPLYTFIDEFGPLLSVAIISGFLVAIIAYFSALYRGAQHRMTGKPLYDFFMGAELNPRMFGYLDFKMFFEVRIPWFILFGLSCGTAARQLEQNGYVSGEVMFLVMAHYLYANACSKGEELIVTTWDMYYEKWGFMLIFWNLAGVPLSYCHCILYLANHHPDEYRWNRWALAALYIVYLFVYWVWDTCNSQKNSFRAEERGALASRATFPQLPWQRLKNPEKIETSTGDAILCDGWYKYARKIHYTCDAFFAICWGLITGFSSPFPWFYPVFFCCMIAHRALRDIQRCRLKYGADWMEYEKRVPYLFIPVLCTTFNKMTADSKEDKVKKPGGQDTTSDVKEAQSNKPSDDVEAGSEDDEEDDAGDADGANGAEGAGASTTGKKKRKRKPRKKKKKGGAGSSADIGAANGHTSQTSPPRVLISTLFPNSSYPEGEIVEYADEPNTYRTTSEEKRHLDNLNTDFLSDYRQAAEVHRQVRQWAQKNIKPGQTLTEIAEGIEDGVRALTGHDGLTEGDGMKAGMGFPCGLSLNHCAAHYTPNAGNKMVLGERDVMKVDFGVHVNGRIVDSAFTMAFDSRYDPLLAAVRAATDVGVREAGIDVRVGDIGAAIQEVMESYEVELDGTTFPVKAIRNLNGHNIKPFSIHGEKSVPIVKSSDQTKMEEGDVFAIETFGSTGNGYVRDDMETSHYARNAGVKPLSLHLASARSLLTAIDKNFGTLPFCRRYLDRIGQEKYLLGLRALTDCGIVEAYPPLVDKRGSYTAQFEHVSC